MPQFEMEGKDDPEFQALDSFTQGYIEAMFFTADTGESGDDEEQEDLTQADFPELTPETLAAIKKDCADFQESNAWCAASGDSTQNMPDDVRAGHDFWFTRNSHGVGFWDGDWPAPHSDALTAEAKKFGETDLYRGDDGLLYLS